MHRETNFISQMHLDAVNTRTLLTKTRSTHQVIFVNELPQIAPPTKSSQFHPVAVSGFAVHLALLHASGSWKTSKPSETFGLGFLEPQGSMIVPTDFPYIPTP